MGSGHREQPTAFNPNIVVLQGGGYHSWRTPLNKDARIIVGKSGRNNGWRTRLDKETNIIIRKSVVGNDGSGSIDKQPLSVMMANDVVANSGGVQAISRLNR